MSRKIASRSCRACGAEHAFGITKAPRRGPGASSPTIRASRSVCANMRATVLPPSVKGHGGPPPLRIPSMSSCSSCCRLRAIRTCSRSSRRFTEPRTTARSCGALIDAAEAGKSVTALVELKARFDEEANIRWGAATSSAPASRCFRLHRVEDPRQDVDGRCAVRRASSGPIATLGTGNYHPSRRKSTPTVVFHAATGDRPRHGEHLPLHHPATASRKGA